MIPLLPSNPLTITPIDDRPVTAQQVYDFYDGFPVNQLMVECIRYQLRELWQLDTYHRRCDTDREQAKAALNNLLKWIEREYPHLLRP